MNKMLERRHYFGVDLLRIVAMLMIVAHHFALHSGITFDPGSSQDILMQIMALSGKTGVNIFVIITGFYSAGKIRKEKILGLIGSTTFYALALTCLAVILGSAPVSKKLFLKAAFPWILGKNYWFVVTYLELYLLTPLLHKVVQGMDTRVLGKYLGIFTCLLCVVPTVLGKFIEINDFGYNALVWFVYLYLLGAYLNKRGKEAVQNIYIAILLLLVQIAATVLLQKGYGQGVPGVLLRCISDYSLNAVFPLVIAVALFQGFRNIEISHGRNLIRAIGASTLGVYLFHDHGYFRHWLWPAVYRLASEIGKECFPVNAMLSVLIVFALGSTIEMFKSIVVRKMQGIAKIKRKRYE